MGKTSDSFLRHAANTPSQYTDGWRQICKELLEERAKNAELWEAVNTLWGKNFASGEGADWDRFKEAFEACRPDCGKPNEKNEPCTLKRDHTGGCIW